MNRTNRRRLVFAGLAIALFGIVLTGTVSGQNVSADYYNNSSTDVGMGSWVDGREDPTLANVTHYLTRVGGSVIGTGTNGAGTLLIGLILTGVVAALTGGSDAGFVGGSVVGLVAISSLVTAGFAPTWLWAVVLFGLGAVVFVVFRRLR